MPLRSGPSLDGVNALAHAPEMAAQSSPPSPGEGPCAPTQAEWDAMSPEERARVVESLPARMTDAEMRPPEGDDHLDAKIDARAVLRRFFERTGRRIYIACELTIYYPGEPRFCPDLIAVTEVEPHKRNKWVVSSEGKGLEMVMEVHVAGDMRKDLERNVVRYARLGIHEYFIYDRGQQRLHGYRLPTRAARVYEAIRPDAGRLASSVLGLDLVIESERLRFYQGTAQLLEADELIGRLQHMVSDLETKADTRVNEALARAEEATVRARALEEEVARLQAELERLRRGGG
jgi:Uma2 family endonuclease